MKRERADRVSLVAGVAVIALGGLLLLDQDDGLELSFGVMAAVIVGVAGLIAGLGAARALMSGSSVGDERDRRQPRHRPLRRDPDDALVAGVCAGVAKRLGIDPLIVRVGFVMRRVRDRRRRPARLRGRVGGDPGRAGARGRGSRRRSRAGRGNWRVAAGVGLLTLSLLLVLRELGIWWSDALIWPLILAASGAALLWRQSRQPSADGGRPSAAASRPDAGSAARPTAIGGSPDLYRGGFGVALVVGAALLFLSANDVLGDTREVLFTRGRRDRRPGADPRAVPLAARPQPRLGARRADPLAGARRGRRAPARLGPADADADAEARRRPARGRAARPAPGARAARLAVRRPRAPAAATASPRRCGRGGEVEDAHRVAIEVVAVGDCELDERAEALVAAAREALSNAAKFAADAGPIARLRRGGAASRAQAFVRDRGAGFDPARCPPTAAACATRSSAGWSATAGSADDPLDPGRRAPRSSSTIGGESADERRRPPSS